MINYFHESIYSLGRIATLTIRPAILILSNNFIGTTEATLLASVFIISPLILILTNTDPHKNYYINYFSNKTFTSAKSFVVYIYSLAFLTLLGGLSIFLYYSLHEKYSHIAFAVMLFFLSEKISDEVLRFLLFKKDRVRWGIITLLRASLQALLIVTIILLFGSDENYVLATILGLSIVGTSVFLTQIPAKKILFLMLTLFKKKKYVKQSYALILTSWKLWLFNITGAMALYTDRIITMLSDAENLAIFTVLVMCMSTVQIIVDFFYISLHRRDFLDGTIDFKKMLLAKNFQKTIGISLAIGWALSLIALFLFKNQSSFPLISITLISVIQVSLITTLIGREIIYWRNQITKALFIEFYFWALAIATFLIQYKIEVTYQTLLLTTATLLTARLLVYVMVTK